MHIVVLGAGAVGGYFGGKLAKAGTEVTFLVRQRRFQQLTAKGLVVGSIHGDFKLSPQITMSVDDIDQPDVVLVALKNYHLQAALPEIRTLVAKGALVLPLLNGVKHIDTLVNEFGRESVLGGLCYIEATLNEAGHVIHTSPMQDIVFGPLSGESHRVLNDLEEAFQQSGVNCRQSASIMSEMWQKFIFLTSFSGITAAARTEIGGILNDRAARPFLEDLIKEIVLVAKSRIGLPEDTAQQVLGKISSVSPSMTSSLHRDLEKGLPLEIDSLQGAVLEMAQAAGVDTPCVRSVYALLHPYKDGTASAS